MNIQYDNQVVASYMLLGSLFIIIGLADHVVFFLLGMLSIYIAFHENKKLNANNEKEPIDWQ